MPRRLLGLAALVLIATPALAQERRGALFEISDGAARPLGVTRDKGVEKLGPARGLLSRALTSRKGAPWVQRLGQGRAVIVWRGDGPPAYAEVENRGGRLIERASGPWPQGWSPAGAGDFDQDGRVDLLLIRRSGQGDRVRVEYLIVRGKDPGFSMPVNAMPANRMLIVARCRTCHFAVADINQDGAPDLLFHVVPHGGSFQTRLFIKYGDGRGRLKHRTHILATVRDALAGIAVADLDQDGDLDIVLAPDDDALNEGRAAVLIQADAAKATFEKGPELDFVPKNAGARPDASAFSLRLADLDGDGQVDLISEEQELKKGRRAHRLRWGLGGGRFDDKAVLTLEKSALRAPRRPRLWLEDRGPAPALETVDAPLKPEQSAALSEALMSGDVAEARGAMKTLRSRGVGSLPLLRSILVPERDETASFGPLLAALEHPSLAVRDQAARRLAGLGPGFGGALEKGLVEARSPEARWRLKVVIAARHQSGERFSSPIGRRRVRAIALLEAIGGEEARRILEDVVAVFGTLGVGGEARSALERLGVRER